MSKPRKDEMLKQPFYKGGETALKQFLQKELKYPKQALELRIEGTVKATYDVDSLGKVRNIKIIEGLGYGCDEEVIRLIGSLKYEKAFNKGRSVTLHRSLKVDFKLPESKQSTNRKMNYHLIKKKEQKAESKPKPNTITYTIKF
ncbi:energy transducer TonB [Roseivirga sp.]|uniref:energy transducer TonB n=1 Tax=Roseivirga sp. TaxID=1964215 RepID=UPI003B51DB7A